jgi:hypothetical protein
MEKIYHIYVKGECKYCNLSEEEFNTIWNYLDKLCWISEIDREDIEYEELDSHIINSIEH